MSRSSITKELECAGRENKVRIHIGSNDSYLMFGLSPLLLLISVLTPKVGTPRIASGKSSLCSLLYL